FFPVVVHLPNGTLSPSTALLRCFSDNTTITATLTASDAAGHSFTAVQTNLALDRDSGEQAALSLTVNGGHPIGAATASAVSFTAVGFESDDNGTVTFSDGSHAPV